MTKVDFLSLPKKSQDVIRGISLKFHEKVENVMQIYQSYYNSKAFKERFSNTSEGVMERHEWALQFVIDNYKAKTPPDIRNLIFFGKSPINAFSIDDIHIRLWAVDTQTEEILLLRGDYDAIKSGDIEQIIFFVEYESVILEPDIRLDFQLKQDNFPMMTTNFVINKQRFFQKMGIKRLQMENLQIKSNFSFKDDKGYYDFTDIRCIPGCTFTKGIIIPRSIGDFKYKLGQIFITDNSTDGFTTDDGLTIPPYFMCWVHPDYVYPENTVANAYGIIRLNKEEDVTFDLIYVDVLVEGIEKDDDKKREVFKGKSQTKDKKAVKQRKKVKKKKIKSARLDILLE